MGFVVLDSPAWYLWNSDEKTTSPVAVIHVQECRDARGRRFLAAICVTSKISQWWTCQIHYTHTTKYYVTVGKAYVLIWEVAVI